MGELEQVVDKLRSLGKKPRNSGRGWVSLCPSHDDTRPSLSVNESSDGTKVLLKCHTGCSLPDILESLDLEMSDLFQEGKDQRKGREFVENYNYTDEEGELLFQVQRFLEPDGRKSFVQRRPDGTGGWIYSTTNIRKPLYHLPQVLKAKKQGKTIWVVEGEKDVQNLEAHGVPATCNAGGAGKWLREHTETLRGSPVVVCSDRDYPGWKHALYVRDDLTGVAGSVTVVQPPDPYKDISEYLATVGRFDAPTFVEKNQFDVAAVVEETDPYREALKDLTDISHKDLRPDQKAQRAKAVLDRLIVGDVNGGTVGRLVRWTDFLKEPVEEYDWVIPNLLERQERVMVVAAEGVGKTMLARQVALMTSAGMHPFSRDAMPRRRTLTFDLENPERIIRRTTKKIMERLRYFRDGDIPAHLVVKPDGFNLLDERDRVTLENYVADIEPDLILLGPIYKTFIDPGGRTAEAVATEIARFFDHIRDVYNCAWWLEHHAPLGSSVGGRDLRPFGSAVWSRWSEFGIALQPEVTDPNLYAVKHYRGMRDQRRWPKTLKRGDTFPFEVVDWL